MNELTHRPTTLSSLGAIVASLVALGAAGYASGGALGVGLIGLGLLGIGLLRGHRGAVDVGGLVLFVAVVLGALAAESIDATLLATIGVVLAWDLGHGAIDLGEQLGRESPTAPLEGVHAVASLLVGIISATLAYGVYVFSTGGQPVAAVVLLIVAACFITIALGTDRNPSKRRVPKAR